MKIRNKHLSPIGFGSTTVLPDSVSDELPREFTASHPVVKFYLSRGWIEVIGGEATTPTAQSVNINVPPAGGAGGSENGDNGGGAQTGGENTGGNGNAGVPSELEKRLKEIAKMNLDPLKAEADRLTIEYPADATRAVLIDLISKKLLAEQG